MREILFRAKIKTNNAQHITGDWVQGDYVRVKDGSRFIPHIYGKGEVVENTVGQYTGLKDKNGKKIFEGDIVKAQDDILGSPFCYGITGKIVFEESAFFIEPRNPFESEYLFNECAVYEVIGNIHDNPELLGGADNG